MRLCLLLTTVALLAASCATDPSPTETGGTSPAPTVTSTTSTTSTTPTTLPSSTTTTTLPATTTTTTSIPTVEECLAKVPIDIRLGQLLLPVVTQADLDAATDLAAAGTIAGVVVIGAPDVGVVDDIAMLQARSLVGPSVIAVDEEGGRVQRLAHLVGRLPSARATAAQTTPVEARERARSHAAAISALGFTMNLAPVLDLDIGAYIRDRSFGADPDAVVAYGRAVVDGIRDAGVTPVVKHFPGHGRGVDSHSGLPELPPLDVLRESDLIPFTAAAEWEDVPVMVGHLVVPGLTDGEPASLSPAAVDGLLRGELGFDGLVMTDAFNMDAIAVRRTAAEAAELALAAGVDLAMLGRVADVGPTLDWLVTAVTDGRLPEASVNESFLRVLAAKGLTACEVPADEGPAIRCDGVSTGGCALAAG